MLDGSAESAGGGSVSGLLTVDLSALRRNYLWLCERAAQARVAAVVKADAYGLGAQMLVPVLDGAGCRDFFVAHLSEAVALRPHVSAGARLFVLNGLQPGEESAAATLGIIPVLNSLEQLASWAGIGVSLGRKLPGVLQFDTGMSRLGLSEIEAAKLRADRTLSYGVDVCLVMSHLASADEPESDQNLTQLRRMLSVAELYPEAGICFANSGGILLGKAFHGVLVRPGIALYGGAPTLAGVNPMEPVVGLEVAVIQTRVVSAGTRVGYSGTFEAAREMHLATIAAGYADGLPRSLSGVGAAYYAGVRLPIVGRVSMDSMTIDISALPRETLTLGSRVEIIGPHQSLEMLAADAGTIGYEILTSLGKRYSRRYVDALGPKTTSPRSA
jgi:alanine racemase